MPPSLCSCMPANYDSSPPFEVFERQDRLDRLRKKELLAISGEQQSSGQHVKCEIFIHTEFSLLYFLKI